MIPKLVEYTAPVAEPIHLTEAKLHLKLGVDAAACALYTQEDDLLSAWISGAREMAETETWKALVLRTMDAYYDSWPEGDDFELPLPPLRKISFIKYTDVDGIESTFSADDYDVDTKSVFGRAVLGFEKIWPQAVLTPTNPIHIRFMCGYLVPFSVDSETDVVTTSGHPFGDGDNVRLSVSGGALPAGLSLLTDYYIVETAGDTFRLSLTSGGVAVDITDNGSGNMFVGEIPKSVNIGMKLVLTDLYENRGDTTAGSYNSKIYLAPRSAAVWFEKDSARRFV